MKRRHFIRKTCLALSLVLGAGSGVAQEAPGSDAQSGVVHSKRLASGVPLGGVGAGTFQLLTDGTVSRATLTNNWSHPTGDLPACFAAFWMRSENKTTARVLALRSPYGLPTVTALDYDGLTPQAILDYPDAAPPVTLSLRAFSPLVPFDLRNSSFPAAAFVFRLRNRSPLPVEVSVALSWESVLGVGGTARSGAFADRTGSRITPLPAEEGFFGLQFLGPPPTSSRATADRLRDNATGNMALLTLPPRGQAVVTSASWNALASRPDWWEGFATEGQVTGRAEPGDERTRHPAGVVAVRLTLRPNDFVEIPFAIAWYTPRCYTLSGVDYGHYYQNMFSDAADAARTLLSEWRVLYALTDEWQKRLLFSNLPRWQARRLINSAAPLIANTLHTRDGRFAFLTTAPPASPGGKEGISDKERRNGGMNSLAPGRSDTNSNAPPQAATGTLIRDGGGSLVQEGRLASVEQRLPASALLLAFFPQLNALDLQRFATSITPEGQIPPPGDWETTLDLFRPASLPTPFESPPPLPNDGKRPEAEPPTPSGTQRATPGTPSPTLAAQTPTNEAVRNSSAFVLQVAQYVLMTGDRAFLDSLFPAVRRGLTWLFARRSLEERSPSPSAPPAPHPATAILRLAALSAGHRLATLAGDAVVARQCADAFNTARGDILAEAWNGRFFAEEGKASDLCATDQLLGQWAAEALDLGALPPDQSLLLPEPHITGALASLQTGNDRARDFPFGPPYRVSAEGKPPPNDPVSHDCVLSASLLGQAALYIAHGQPEAGVALWQRLDTTRTETLRSPWHSAARFRADTGQTDAPLSDLTQAADWNLLAALEGLRLDLHEGHLVLSPRIPGTWRSLTTPVFAPTFWGRLDYKPTARGGSITLRVDRLIALQAATPLGKVTGKPELVLKSLRVPGPPPRPDNPRLTVLVSLGSNSIGHRVTSAPGGDLRITFETPLTLSAGDRLEILVR